MRGHRRAKAIPTVEALESKALPSATIAGMHRVVTDSVAAVAANGGYVRNHDGLQLRARALGTRRLGARARLRAEVAALAGNPLIVAPRGGFPLRYGLGSVGGGLGIGPNPGISGDVPTQGASSNSGNTGTTGIGTTGIGTTGTTGIGTTGTTGTGTVGTGTTPGATTTPVGTVIGTGGTGTSNNGGLIFGPVSPTTTGTGGSNVTGTGETSIGQTNTGTAGSGSQASGSNTNTTG